MELALGHNWYGMMSPRFTALITTVDKDGTPNAAPHSFVMPFSHEPPVACFSVIPSHHTLANVRETGEFVINVAPEPILRQMLICSRHYPKGVNEIKEAGLTKRKSKLVKPPSIEECVLWIECRYILEVAFPTEISDHNMIFGRVVRAECKDEFVTKDEFDALKAKPILHNRWGREAFIIAERVVGRPKGEFREVK